MIPCVLTIAGSDSGGGAGIQADIKTFTANGCYALSAITSLTAQNTQEVRSVSPLSTAFIADQIDVLFADFPIQAVKIGMLYNQAIIELVAEKLLLYRPSHIVLDPVMVAQSGQTLLEPQAFFLLVKLLFPLATLITPNLVEASTILQKEISVISQMPQAAQMLLQLGAQAVLLKGGHLECEKGTDYLLISNGEGIWIQKECIDSPHTHGTGCTYSSAIAANLAKGFSIMESVKLAKDYLHGAILAGKTRSFGQGKGPVNHFWRCKCTY